MVAALFVALLLTERFGEWSRLRAQVQGFPWRLHAGWLAAATLLAAAALGVTAAAWVFLFRGTGARIGLGRGVAAWMGSNLGRYIPGKVWQLSGLAIYLRARGHSASAAVATSVQLQVLTLLTGAAFAGLAGLDAVGRIAGSAWALVAVGVLLALLLHPAVVRRATRIAARWLREEEAAGAGEAAPPGALLGAGVALAGVWLLYGAAFWCFLRGAVGPAATPGPLAATGIFAASYVAGFLVVLAPGGLVVREGAMTGLLVALTPQPAPVAALVAVGARIWATVAELVAVAAALALARRGGEGA